MNKQKIAIYVIINLAPLEENITVGVVDCKLSSFNYYRLICGNCSQH